MLERLLVTDVYLFLAIFARLGAAIMVLPGFGELTIPARVRLALALTLTFVLFPLVVDLIPEMPSNPFGLAAFIGGEVLIGIVIGALAILMGAYLWYLRYQNARQAVPSLHHLMLFALVDSYELFIPGGGFPVGDVSDLAAQFVSRSFQLGLQIAMPVVIVGVMIYISMGLMARLMPQIQVFFIALPLQMLIAFAILALTVGASMLLFLDQFEATIRNFLIAG